MLREIFDQARPAGHHEDADSLNLGFGYLYYGMVHALRPKHVVVFGSTHGFSVVCMALGLKDNGAGRLSFVDPAHALRGRPPFRVVGGESPWSDAVKVKAHFSRFGVEHIVTHHKRSSEEFLADYASQALPAIDLAFIDGNHGYESLQQCFLGVLRHARRNSYILLHDTHAGFREWAGNSGVKRWLRKVAARRDAFETVNFPFSSGVAVVRVTNPEVWDDADD